MAITQVSNNLVKQDLTISGGTVDNTVIGSGTPAAGTFTTIGGTLASSVVGTTQSAGDNSTKIATTGYVETAIANLADSAPSTLDTLNELAAALGDDANFSTTVTNNIATKLPLAGGTLTGDLLVSVAAGNPSLTLKTAGVGNNPHINYRAGNSIVFDTMLVASAATDYWRVGYGASGSVTSEFLAVTSAGNVGIGTTSPDGTLHVKDTVAQVYIQSNDGQASQIVFGDVSDASRGRINYDSSDSMIFETNNLQERMRIDSSGYVNPNANVALTNAPDTQGLHFGWNHSNFAGESLIVFNKGAGATGGLTFVDNSDGGTHAERMRIDSSGNVGINTTDPSAIFEVRATAPTYTNNGTVFWGGTTNNDAHNGIMLSSYGDALAGSIGSNLNHSNGTVSQTNTNRSSAEIQFSNTTTSSVTSSILFGGYVKGSTTFTERMRIDSSGNVGIGQSVPYNSSKLDVVGSIISTSQTIALYAADNAGFDFAAGTKIGRFFSTSSDATGGHMTFITGAGGGAERMRIDSSGNVGIGCTPSRNLDIQGTGDTLVSIVSPASNQSALFFGDTDSDSIGRVAYDNSDNSMRFTTNASEAMRIDSSGNVLVGGTNSRPAEFSHPKGISFRGDIGQIQASTDGNIPIVINRDSSDGDLIYMLREGAVVGSIGSVASNYLSIGTGDTGLLFQDDNDFIEPCNVGTSAGRDAAIDLGQPGGRFKDLYLSGGAYIGGTAAANKLDDYEEGTWTPAVNAGSISGTSITYTGSYTKIGRQVFIYFNANSTSGDINISSYVAFSGLPFSITYVGTGTVITEDIDVFDRQGYATISGTILTISKAGSSSGTNSIKVGIVGTTS